MTNIYGHLVGWYVDRNYSVTSCKSQGLLCICLYILEFWWGLHVPYFISQRSTNEKIFYTPNKLQMTGQIDHQWNLQTAVASLAPVLVHLLQCLERYRSYKHITLLFKINRISCWYLSETTRYCIGKLRT